MNNTQRSYFIERVDEIESMLETKASNTAIPVPPTYDFQTATRIEMLKTAIDTGDCLVFNIFNVAIYNCSDAHKFIIAKSELPHAKNYHKYLDDVAIHNLATAKKLIEIENSCAKVRDEIMLGDETKAQQALNTLVGFA